jgi:hypothetical protein
VPWPPRAALMSTRIKVTDRALVRTVRDSSQIVKTTLVISGSRRNTFRCEMSTSLRFRRRQLHCTPYS